MSQGSGRVTVPVVANLPFNYDPALPVEPNMPEYDTVMPIAKRNRLWQRIYADLGLTGSDQQAYYTQVHIDFIKNGTSPKRSFVMKTVTVGGQEVSMKPIDDHVKPEFRKFADADYAYLEIMCKDEYKSVLTTQMTKYGATQLEYGRVCFDFSTRITGLNEDLYDFAKRLAVGRLNVSNIGSSKATLHSGAPVIPAEEDYAPSAAYNRNSVPHHGY